MSENRIVYQNWIVDLGRDPDRPALSQESTSNDREVADAVQRALSQLSDDEREFIVRFYFMGQTYQDLSVETGRAEHKLTSLHRRTVRKMKTMLAEFVQCQFGVKSKPGRKCPLCSSRHRKEIDQLIARRDRTATWRPVMRILKEQFDIRIRTPQLLIGHEKYHMLTENHKDEA